MPTQPKPTAPPPAVPTPPKAESRPASTPAASASKAPPLVAFDVECVNADSLETAVQVEEEGIGADGKPTKALHACVRRVYHYRFELVPAGPSHPKVRVTIETLEPQPWSPKGRYILSLQE